MLYFFPKSPLLMWMNLIMFCRLGTVVIRYRKESAVFNSTTAMGHDTPTKSLCRHSPIPFQEGDPGKLIQAFHGSGFVFCPSHQIPRMSSLLKTKMILGTRLFHDQSMFVPDLRMLKHLTDVGMYWKFIHLIFYVMRDCLNKNQQAVLFFKASTLHSVFHTFIGRNAVIVNCVRLFAE